jgi:hypothetical protein
MTGGSRADGVQLVGRRRAVKLSHIGFGGVWVIRYVSYMRSECILNVFWMYSG